MKPRVLVIYYSQSGQLTGIIRSVLSGVQEELEIDYCEIRPVKPFPFPWTPDVFFDCMPESVLLVPENIQPLKIPGTDYDLVILGYQPWFLSPSIPFNSFLHSDDAAFLSGKNVLTIVGSRNMWLNAHEKTKMRLQQLGARLVGNIVLFDRSPNLLSLLAINRWSFTGRKEAGRFLPEAGVHAVDIRSAARFGPVILQSLRQHDFGKLQENLLELDAVVLRPGLVVLEKRGVKTFRKFAVRIRQHGERGHPARIPGVRLFRRLLDAGVFILSPISALTAFITRMIHKKKLLQDVEYFKNTGYRENAI